MYSHAGDLRAELLQTDMEPAAAHGLVDAVLDNWDAADLPAPDQALCAFAEKLTATPGAMAEADVEALRSVGFDDEAVHDAIQVVSYFNYINRVAEAVRVDLEPEMPPYGC